MDNLDDSENNAKVSDSAYSNSCSNSQSRRSHSSKSTHSGSNSSGSSGYGGKPSTSSSSNTLDQSSKKDKDSKKKKQPQIEVKAVEEPVVVEVRAPEPIPLFNEPIQATKDVIEAPTPVLAVPEKVTENMDISSHLDLAASVKDEVMSTSLQTANAFVNVVTSRPNTTFSSNGFSCVISMHDGVVMYTTTSLTATLGFPKDMWIGRSFIDFVHPKDRNTFASQITKGLAVPKIVNGTQEKAQSEGNSCSTMLCRLRRYRGLSGGFGVKDRVVIFMPFLLKFTFKNISDEEGKFIYLVLQATPFYSAFKTPNELVTKPVPFVLRHAADGHIEYIDPESVSYLGYLPQDVQDEDALQLYHPEDLPYLKQIYENIVKEGSVTRSKPYRMMAQNGDYIKLETEWSSFINPWSMKLEFIIGKHHVLEGPANPDVFQSPASEKNTKISDEEKNKAKANRESIIRIMNEVLTKPAEVAKQQMSKRCQDLALFMESLMEEQPKIDDELRLEIQDPDHSYYERDSVMLGGISPHHDSYDGKSSTETPLSYNQLNYNENLQRYFDSSLPHCYEDYSTVAGENVLGLKDVAVVKPVNSKCPSPCAQQSGESNQMSSCGSSGAVGVETAAQPAPEYQPPRLTESLLNKHNAEMEKELVKMHRETRSSSKGEREKASNETRQKKKEHLARCNASFQPTLAGRATTTIESQGLLPHGVKRSSKHMETQDGAQKNHSPARQSRRRLTTSAAQAQPSSTITTTVAASHWPANPVSNINAFLLGVGIPQQMSLMSAMPAMPGVFPMYYAPVPMAPTTSDANRNATATTSTPQFAGPAMQCMMYGQPMYGSPFVYSPMNQQLSYPVQQSVMGPTMPLGLTNNNYEENTEAAPDPSASRESKSKTTGNSEETVDRTDGESNYSSFYSSFFKTESGSAEDSGDLKKGHSDGKQKNPMATAGRFEAAPQVKKMTKRKLEPPWMEQVCVTSELIYKYQILTKTMDEVLVSDKEKMDALKQPSLVNEQLGQLYLDLQLEGVAARLTLEEGITSSSSSGEETIINSSQGGRRKREYSKLVMIYEEDAPLPPPSDAEETSKPSQSS